MDSFADIYPRHFGIRLIKQLQIYLMLIFPKSCPFLVVQFGADLILQFLEYSHTPEQPHKQVKLGTLEYSGINQAIQNISAHAGNDPPSFLEQVT